MNSDEPDSVVEFPRMAEGSDVRSTRTEKFRGWSSSPDKAFRLQAQVEDILAKAYENYLDAHPDLTQSQKNRVAQSMRLRVSVWSNKKATLRTGSLRDILEQIDADEIQQMRLGNVPADGLVLPTVKVLFDRDGGGGSNSPAPVNLVVSGNDRQWVGGVVDTLATTLKKNRPAWSILRLMWPSFVLGFLATAGAFSALFMFTSMGEKDLAERIWFVVLVGLMSTFMGGTIVFRIPAMILLPGFEIVELGKKSRAVSVGSIIGGVVSAAVAISGLVLSLISLA